MNQAHFGDDRDLLGDGLDAALRDDESEQHTPWDPKNALLGVEFDAVCLEFHEGLLLVGYDLVSRFGFDHDVVDIGLDGLPDEIPETLEHAALVRSPRVLQAK